MSQKIKIFDKEYDSEKLSPEAQSYLTSLRFTISRIEELTNTQRLLQRAKNSYVDDLKKEVLASKAGYLFNEN